MQSKNNYSFLTKEKQRFGLRKLSIGVASVLLGTTLLAYSGETVNADSATPTTQTQSTENQQQVTAPDSSVGDAVKATIDNKSQAQQETPIAPSKQGKQQPATPANNDSQATETPVVNQGEAATLDLTFVDDDKDGSVIQIPSSIVSSQNGGHIYIQSQVGKQITAQDKIFKGKRSIQDVIGKIGDRLSYELSQNLEPIQITSTNTVFSIHMKHQTEPREYNPITVTRTLHYAHGDGFDGMPVKDAQGNDIPDYQEQYTVTPTEVTDLVTYDTYITYAIKNEKTGKTTIVKSDSDTPLVLHYDSVASPEAAGPWEPVKATAAGTYELPSFNYWRLVSKQWEDRQTVGYIVDYNKIKIGDYVPYDQIPWTTGIETSADGTKETVYRYFFYALTDDNDAGINIDHSDKHYYGGRQALEFTREKNTDANGNVTYGEWKPVTTDTFPEYVYANYYHPKGYEYKNAHAPALKFDPNTTDRDIRVFDPYGPLYKVSIIDDTTGKTLNIYEENPVPELGYQDTLDQAEKQRQAIYNQVDTYLKQGYTKVSDDFGQISVNNQENANHSEGMEEYAKYVYTIHLTQLAVPHTDHKTATRIIHFVADNGHYSVLQEPQTQVVHFTTTYYTDHDGNLVNVKVNDQGQAVIDKENTNPVTKIWSLDYTDHPGVKIDNGQASYDKVQQDQINIVDGALKGNWKINRASMGTADGFHLISKYAPEEQISNDIPDGTVENVYLIYDLESDHEVTPPTPDKPGDDTHHEVTPPTPDKPGDDTHHEVTPPTPDKPGDDTHHEVTPPTPDKPGDDTHHEVTPPTPDKPNAGTDHETASQNPEDSHENWSNQTVGVVKQTQDDQSNVEGKPEQDQATLPQTGSKSDITGLVGLGLASLATLLGFGMKKKQF